MGSDMNERVTSALEKYSNMVRRICYIYFKNSADIDDIFQDVFLKFLQHEATFQSEEHEKAWLIRVTINRCKDVVKSFWRKNVGSIEEIDLPFEDETESELMRAVLSLPQKYKDVIYLFYYEDDTVPQMAKLLNQKENTIYSNLHRARSLLKQKLEGNADEYSF